MFRDDLTLDYLFIFIIIIIYFILFFFFLGGGGGVPALHCDLLHTFLITLHLTLAFNP